MIGHVTPEAITGGPIGLIKEGDTNENKTLKNSDYRREGYIAIGFRKQNGEMIFSPKADFVIKKGMEVMLFGAGKKKKLI